MTLEPLNAAQGSQQGSGSSTRDSSRSCTSSCGSCTRAAARIRELEAEFEKLRVSLAVDEDELSPTSPLESSGTHSASPTRVSEEGVGGPGIEGRETDALVDEAELHAEVERMIEDGNRLRITLDTLVRGSIFEAKELVR